MTSSVFALGECMLEVRKSAGAEDVHIGGDVFNVLAMMQSLGTPTQFLTGIGNDDNAKILREHMLRFQVGLQYGVSKTAKTGRYIVIVDERGERHFEYDRKGSAASLYAPSDLPLKDFSKAGLVLSSGITQAISKTCREAVKKLFQQARVQEIRTAFDINYRSRLWETPTAAAGGLLDVLHNVDILFLSEDDLPILSASLGGVVSSPQDLAKCFEKTSVQILIFRQGEQGAQAWTREGQHLTARSPRVSKVVDTTGAGDIFAGAFLHSLLQGQPVDKCLENGVFAGSQHVQSPGALTSLPRLNR